MDLATPAPVWRRFAASIYDGLLLIALWMVAALVDVLVRDALGIPRSRGAFQGLVFLIGCGFFGWFWIHGGQTLGMRVWKLRVQRSDGLALGWPLVMLRYVVMLITWLALLLPALLQSKTLAEHIHVSGLATGCIVFCLFALIATASDRRRRTPCDFIAGTEVVWQAKADVAA